MAKPKKSPFKTRKTRSEVPGKAADTITPPANIQKAIDSFREFQEQAKHFEGEATVCKDEILQYSQEEFSKRVLKGQASSFKLLGEETMVHFVIQDSSAGLTEEDVAEFGDKWGKEVAEELITRDFGSIRFNGEVLEANYEAVVEALQTLPESVLDNLFKPMLMKAVPGALEKAKKHAKNSEKLQELIHDLKLKNYIK